MGRGENYSGYGGGGPRRHQIPILRVVFPSPRADLSHQILHLGGSTIKPGGLTDLGQKKK